MMTLRSALASMLLATAVATTALDVGAADEPVALGEVATPAPSTGLDRATLKSAAETELRGIDASRVKKKRVVVSVAVTSATEAPVGCTVNAVLRDARSGTMIAIVEGRARTEGTANADSKRAVLRAAVRSAVRQIPDALAGN